ncbi:MAG: antibiotic biosynthesis monooxygenase [Aquabacterium sp.]|nr:antibiotic biosynthesis monooxygenase [Aquabacterium sp.]
MKPSNAAAAMAAACVLCLPGAPAVAQEEPIVVFSRIFVTPGREAEAEARLAGQAEYVQQALPGITYKFYRATKTPGLFVTYEVFPDRATAQRVLKELGPAFRAKIGPAPEGLYSQPAEFEVMRPVVRQ